MKMVGLMLRLTGALWSTGKAVIMDSICFVLKGLLEMSKRVVYVNSFIKQRRYWPREVYGYYVNDYFRSKNIGDLGSLSGEQDKTEFKISVLKEPSYSIMIMSTFSVFTVPEGLKEERMVVNGQIAKFKYPEVVTDHYRYREAVDNHNALRHDGGTKSQFGLESKLGTTWWSIRFFAFSIACTEVNAYLAMKCFLKTDDKFM